MAQSDSAISPTVLAEAGLTRTKSEKFDFFVEQRLWNPPRIQAAIQALDKLNSLDLSKPFQFKNFPTSSLSYIESQIGKVAHKKDGTPSLTLDSEATISMQANLEIEIEGKKYPIILSRTPTKSETRANPSAEEITDPIVDNPKQEFGIHLVSPSSDTIYWRAVNAASKLLKERREYWETKYELAKEAFAKRNFGGKDALDTKKLVGSISDLPRDLQREISLGMSRLGVSEGQLQSAKLVSAKQEVYVKLKVGRVSILLTPKQLFDQP